MAFYLGVFAFSDGDFKYRHFAEGVQPHKLVQNAISGIV